MKTILARGDGTAKVGGGKIKNPSLAKGWFRSYSPCLAKKKKDRQRERAKTYERREKSGGILFTKGDGNLRVSL